MTAEATRTALTAGHPAALKCATAAPGYDSADFHVLAETAALDQGSGAGEHGAGVPGHRWRSFRGLVPGSRAGVALPATAQTMAAYLTHLAVDRGLKATTADAHLTAIRAVHPGRRGGTA